MDESAKMSNLEIVDAKPNKQSLAGPELALSFHIGSRIRLRRVALGLDVDAFASAIGVPVEKVSDLESGSVRVDPAQLFRISNVLAAPIGFFFRETKGRSVCHQSCLIKAD